MFLQLILNLLLLNKVSAVVICVRKALSFIRVITETIMVVLALAFNSLRVAEMSLSFCLRFFVKSGNLLILIRTTDTTGIVKLAARCFTSCQLSSRVISSLCSFWTLRAALTANLNHASIAIYCHRKVFGSVYTEQNTFGLIRARKRAAYVHICELFLSIPDYSQPPFCYF